MAWRSFAFFERHALEASKELVATPWACSVAGSGGTPAQPLLFFGDDAGGVAAADARLQPQGGWRAHEGRCSHLAFLPARTLLVSLGEEEAGPTALASTTVKVWDTSRLRLSESEAGGAPPCLRALRLFAPRFPPAPLTPAAFVAAEDGTAQLVRPQGPAEAQSSPPAGASRRPRLWPRLRHPG